MSRKQQALKKISFYIVLAVIILWSVFYFWQEIIVARKNRAPLPASNIILKKNESGKMVLSIDGEKKKAFVYSDIKKILSVDMDSLPESDWEKFPQSGIYEVQDKEEKHLGKNNSIPYLIKLSSEKFLYGEAFSAIYPLISKNTRVIVLNPSKTGTDEKKDDLQKGYVFKDPLASSNINGANAEAYIIGDLETGEIIASKNENKIFPIASVSKLMTAIVAKESLDMGNKIKIRRSAMDEGYGNYGGFKIGEEYKGEDLLYPLLLSSSNEAAIAFSESLGKEKFITLMNERAKKIGMENTSFAEPSGLSPKNVSTVTDLFKLSIEIFKNQKEILSITKEKKGDKWQNINTYAGSSKFLGGKTGYTDEALKTSVGLFSLPLTEYGSRPLGIVILHSLDWKKDTEKIISWATETIEYRENSKQTPITKEDFYLENLGLDSVLIRISGGIRLDKNMRDYIAYNESGDFSVLFKKSPLKKDDGFTIGILKSSIHPLFASSLASVGYNALVVQNTEKETERRLSMEKIASLKTEPVILQKSKDDMPLGLLKIEYSLDSRKAQEKIRESLNVSKSLVVLVDPLKSSQEKFESFAKNLIDSGASLIAIYNSPEENKKKSNQTGPLRYKDGLIISGLGEFVGLPGEKGSVFEIRISGIGRIISVKETPVKIDAQFRPVSEKAR